MLARVGLLVLAAACNPRTPPERDGGDGHDVATTTGGGATATDSTDPADRPIAELRPFEEATRASFDFERPPSAETGLGADPWTIRRVPGGWVGILRGRSAIVLLDEDLHELARLPSPRSPTGLALTASGEVLVVGEFSPNVARYAVRGRTLEPRGEVRVPGVMGLRDVAVSPAGTVVWALDERGGRVLGLDAKSGNVVTSLPVGHGAVQVLATAKHLVIDAVTDHALLVFDIDAGGAHEGQTPRRITHDGPMWGFDVRETERGLLLAAGGVEDHPLDRRKGFFGYIDSFVYVYRMQDTSFEKLAALNVSEQGVVTPKAVSVRSEAGRVELLVTGYGSASGLRIDLRNGEPAVMTKVPLVPGIRALEHASRTATGAAMADPLLDAWVLADARGVRVVPVPEPVPPPARASRSRLGEALFFTSLMAPRNSSEGSLSRFTCETCHFEGYVDGRTHHTGREEIHATTKPLVGLVGNRPYFSRALDPDLATVSHSGWRARAAAPTPCSRSTRTTPRMRGSSTSACASGSGRWSSAARSCASWSTSRIAPTRRSSRAPASRNARSTSASAKEPGSFASDARAVTPRGSRPTIRARTSPSRSGRRWC
jgi:hypothetical protein